MSKPDRLRRIAPTALATLFAASGVAHFLRPETFTGMVPRAIPASPETVVYASGAAELVLAVGLLRRKRRAGVASAVLLTLFFWSHVQMLGDFRAKHGETAIPTIVAWARLPLQLGLIWAALQSDREEKA